MVKLFFYFLIFVSFNFHCNAQSSILRGFVADNVTGEPMICTKLVVISPDSSTQRVVTNVDGFFQFDKLNPDVYVLEATNIGYDTLKRNVELLETNKVTSIKLYQKPILIKPEVLSVPIECHQIKNIEKIPTIK